MENPSIGMDLFLDTIGMKSMDLQQQDEVLGEIAEDFNKVAKENNSSNSIVYSKEFNCYIESPKD